MSFSRFYNGIQAESDQKDLIISQLKAELYELNQGQQDQQILIQQINMLDSRYQQLQEDSIRTDREGRQRAEQNHKTISNLRDELDLLKQEILSRNREVQEFKADNNSLQEIVQFRTNELQKIRAEIQDLQEQGRKLQEQKKILERTLKRLKDDRSQLSQENEALKNEYDQLYQKSRMIDQNIKDTELEINKIEKILSQQSKQGENLGIDVRNKQENLEQSKLKLQQNQKNLQLLLNDIGQLERLIQKAQQEAKENQQLLHAQIQKQKDLQNKITNHDKNIREKEIQIQQTQLQIEEDTIKSNNLQESNKTLNLEIERSLDIITHLNEIRKELIDEIQLFQQEDERALMLLRRLERQKDQQTLSQNRVDQSLQNISHFINNKSPE